MMEMGKLFYFVARYDFLLRLITDLSVITLTGMLV